MPAATLTPVVAFGPSRDHVAHVEPSPGGWTSCGLCTETAFDVEWPAFYRLCERCVRPRRRWRRWA